jgi:hypothetical protein
LAYTLVPLLEPDKVSRRVAEGAVTEPIGLLGWLLDHLGTAPLHALGVEVLGGEEDPAVARVRLVFQPVFGQAYRAALTMS